MTELTTAKLREMLECAQKATPGPYTVCRAGKKGTKGFFEKEPRKKDGRDCACGLVWSTSSDWTVAHTDTSSKEEGVELHKKTIIRNAKYFANMDPQTTIAIIEECLRARGETV